MFLSPFVVAGSDGLHCAEPSMTYTGPCEDRPCVEHCRKEYYTFGLCISYAGTKDVKRCFCCS